MTESENKLWLVAERHTRSYTEKYFSAGVGSTAAPISGHEFVIAASAEEAKEQVLSQMAEKRAELEEIQQELVKEHGVDGNSASAINLFRELLIETSPFPWEPEKWEVIEIEVPGYTLSFEPVQETETAKT